MAHCFRQTSIQIVSPTMTNTLYTNQFGLPYNCDVTIAKVYIIYNATTNIADNSIHPIRGVPQGSVFCPLFFLIYFEDILRATANQFNEAKYKPALMEYCSRKSQYK